MKFEDKCDECNKIVDIDAGSYTTKILCSSSSYREEECFLCVTCIDKELKKYYQIDKLE